MVNNSICQNVNMSIVPTPLLQKDSVISNQSKPSIYKLSVLQPIRKAAEETQAPITWKYHFEL